MTDAYARFIAAESARLRSHGIPEARIAWLLGTKPANANRPAKVDTQLAVRLRADGASWRELGRKFDVRSEVVRRAVKMATDPAYRAKLLKQQAGYAKSWRARKSAAQ